MDAFQFLECPPKDLSPPVAVIFGDETFLRQQCLEVLREKLLGDESDCSLLRFGGAGAQLADVLDALSTPSLFGERRVVLVEDADDFVSQHREALERYVASPSRWGTLILTLKSFPSNTRLAKAVAKTGLALGCKAPRPHEAQRWLARWSVQRYGKKLSSAAAGLLIEAVGANLGVLDSELQKLSAAAGDRKEIRDEDVELLAPKSAERTTWEMIDALAEGRTAEALGILERVLTAGEAEVAIMGALSWHLRNLARAGRLAVAGMPVRRALQEAGVKPFALERSERHLRRLGRQRVEKLYRWLVDADLDLKGRSAGPRPLVLETLLVRLADG